MLRIINGVIHDAIHRDPFTADLLIDGGKIAGIGSLPETECEVFDACGLDIWPGFIDAHTHIGMFGFAGKNGATKDDVEKYSRCTPENRGIDAINPMEPSFAAGLSAGVTAVCVGPGSVNCMGGTHAVVKTYGHRIDDMIVRDPAAMKIAFGENPKTTLLDKLTTRMTIAADIREMLYKAKEYMYRLEAAGDNVSARPAWHAGYEALIPVLRRQIPLKAHVHRADDVFTAIRIAKELDVALTLEHVSEAALIVDDLAAEGYSVALGPYISQPQKQENMDKDLRAAVRLMDKGVNVCVMTDSPIIAEENLPLCAGMLMRAGMDGFRALQAITINAARHLWVDDRLGSIETGKDADLVLTQGCPLCDLTAFVRHVWVSGVMVR